MNSDDFTSPTSPTSSSASHILGRRIRVRSLKKSLTGQEASLPSVHSDDNDWVSPFTLPPLPALRKNRAQVDREPEDRQQDRSGSSAYYAAAWGSPYATPSPHKPSASTFDRNKAIDLESSPLVSRDRSVSRHAPRDSIPARDTPSTNTDRSASSSPIDGKRKSQRRNWLSESEESGSDSHQNTGRTPKQRKHITDSFERSAARTHAVKESVDTITPETFNGASGIIDSSDSPIAPIVAMAELQNSLPLSATDETSFMEKPLPNLPMASSAFQQASPVISRPPVSFSTQSFQRPKKKVPWKGKSCIIAMPLTDRAQAGLPSVMSLQEKRDRIQMWIDLGYPVHGFNVGDWYSDLSGAGGASRSTYPDFADMDLERKTTGPSVRIPNQSEWEAWVEYLKEEKLRALGVTSSTSEAPPSTSSPFSSTISRMSSTYPSVTASPPIPPLSVASSHPRMTHSPYSPSISIPAHSTYFSHRGTPGLQNGSRPMHGYTQSIAIPGMGQRMNSPFDYPISQPYGSGMRSPADQMGGRRSFTPGHIQNMQSMGHILSPVNMPQQEFARSFSPNPQIEQIRRQQEALSRHQQQVQAQIVRAQHQRQMSMFPLRTMSTEQIPVTPKIASPEREPPEIMHPTPRSHRHNLSAALEKGVTDSVAASTKGLSQVINGNQIVTSANKERKDDIEEGEIVEEDEEAQEELPILHRPETIKDADELAEVETNPSIAGTPLLLEDRNPFSSFKPLPLPQSAVKRPGVLHTVQPSFSTLNVQAKEFSPTKSSFPSNPFNFDGDAFADREKEAEKKVSHATRPSHRHNPSSLGLNVAAPVFNPTFASKSTLVEQPDDSLPEEPSLPSISQEVTPAKSNYSTDFVSSLAGFQTADQSTFSTPIKPVFNPASSAFSFTYGKQQDVTPLKSEAEPQSSAFSFRSANFNVEAPVFKPQGLSVSSIDFTPERPKDFMNGTIFGDVVLDPSSKPMRRNKALPIMKPSSREVSPEQVEIEHFDAEGRPAQPADRNKRATRRVGGDSEEIIFADSAPFKSLGNNTEEVNGAADAVLETESEEYDTTTDAAEAIEPVEESAASEVVDEELAVAEPILEASDGVEHTKMVDDDVEDDVHATDAVDASNEVQLSESIEVTAQAEDESVTVPEVAEQVTEEVQLSDSSPPLQAEMIAEVVTETIAEHHDKEETAEVLTKDKNEVVSLEAVDEPARSTPASVTAPTLSADALASEPTQPTVPILKPGLSPFAQPFEFRPAVKEFTPAVKPYTPESSSHDEGFKVKQGGLLASKFAVGPPVAVASTVSETKPSPSPSRELQKVLDSNVEQSRESTPKADPILPMPEEKKETPVGQEPESISNSADSASILEKYREVDSRTGSVISRPGEMSYEEINAVMQQFEDDPDLGVIRDETPVKSTPLIDMRYPQNFRSDAPSPSPRRLDQPFIKGPGRLYNGLGFEISGVHQLNYGSPEVVDWNADLSPGQQDKLEARAHFFDDHVNDLVDNVLESRLAPLEKALQIIQNSVQQASIKPRSSRRSMSTDNKESDADDEDDYDAYEGYSHYRSRSPHKRDRRSEKIKSAVIEAMALAQPAAVDTTSMENILRELRELTQKSTEQPPQSKTEISEIRQALSELRTISQREVQPPVLDTSELTQYVEEIKTIQQQQGPERRADLLVVQLALNELRTLASQKPAPPVVDLSSIQSALTELKQQAENIPIVPEVDLSTIHQALAELRLQGSEKPAPPVIDLSAIHEELAELRKQAAERPVAPEVDLSAIHSALADLKQQAELKPGEESAESFKAMFEDVITTHPRLAPPEVQVDKDALEKLQSEVNNLTGFLKSAEKLADGEAALRREAEEEQEVLHRQIKDAQNQAASYKAASEEAKKKLSVLTEERDATRGLQTELRDVKLKNEALERTLDEYRSFKDEMKDELEKERNRTDSLARALQDARHQHKDYTESRDSHREQLGHLQQRMSKVMQDVHHDEAEWRKREHDLTSKNQLLQAALDHETNRRARVELESERLHKENRDNLHHRSKHETAQDEVSRLVAIVSGLQDENKTHQDTAFTAQRELAFLQGKTEETITSKVSRLQDELDASKATLQALQSDSDARIARLLGQLDSTASESQEYKAKHEKNMEKMFENHNRVVREVEERHSVEHAADLDRRLAFHEEKLIAIKAQHIRDTSLASDEKKHIVQRYEDKLEISKDKITHLESKVTDLQESLAVTRSAARAAVEAATAKGANLPTPASSVMASPPNRGSISSGSMPNIRGLDLPEKISPQALRETIMVLQDQLQNREQKIDKLEAELAAIDKDAPGKVKERDTEIVMLRELLDVRVDDLQELIGTLEKPGYNQTAVKDAAIRLKTQIKMEQQLKERMITGAGLASSLPSSITSGLVNLAQSPRAMVAAAAWGNWRKVRDSGIGAVSDFAINLGSQTPSRVSSAPPSAVTVTSPTTRTKLSSDIPQPSAARPLATAAAVRRAAPASPSSGARPLRAFNAQPRTLSGARPLARRGTNESRPGSSGSVIRASNPAPSTPIQLKAESDFGDDVDEDASPLDNKTADMSSDIEELARTEQNTMKARSPRTSRSFAHGTRKEVVEVFEES